MMDAVINNNNNLDSNSNNSSLCLPNNLFKQENYERI